MKHVRVLAERIGVRVRTTEGEERAATYVARRFEALGYRTHIQKFSVDLDTSRNVVAWWPGARRYPVVIGGHMDTVQGAPGANDNASGVAITLEIARLVAGQPQAKYVKFVAFGSEEYGVDGTHHVGSRSFVDRLGPDGKDRLGGMVSVDMVADGRPLIVGTSGIGPEIVARTLLREIGRAGIEARYQVSCDCSDNGPFERAGIPAAFMWSGDESDYHKPSDTVPNMDPQDLNRSGRAVLAFVAQLDYKTLRRFRQA